MDSKTTELCSAEIGKLYYDVYSGLYGDVDATLREYRACLIQTHFY